MLRRKDQAGADGTIAAFHDGFNFFFQACGGLTNPRVLHLNLLEAGFIKTRRPVLCRQKEFVYTLKLFR